MTIKIKLTPPLRDKFDMARREKVYHDRLIELFHGSETLAKQAHDEWVIHHPPIHHWRTWNMIAMTEATCDLLPSERQLMHAQVIFE